MKKTSIISVCFTAMLAASCLLGTVIPAKADFPTCGQFDQVNTVTVPRFSMRSVQSIAFKDGEIRMDSNDINSLVPTTQIETPDAAYIYCPLGTTGEKIPIKDKQPPLLERMVADTKTKLENATKTGTDTFEGYNCNTYKIVQNGGQVTVEFWVSVDPSFPFLLKTVETDSLLQKTTTVELQNIVLNNSLDDSLFAIPTDIKFTVPTPPAPSNSAAGGTGSTSHSTSTTAK